jgi:hypothetical protein
VQNEDSKSLIEADKRIRNIFKDNDFVQNENSKSLIEADKRIRNISPKAK